MQSPKILPRPRESESLGVGIKSLHLSKWLPQHWTSCHLAQPYHSQPDSLRRKQKTEPINLHWSSLRRWLSPVSAPTSTPRMSHSLLGPYRQSRGSRGQENVPSMLLGGRAKAWGERINKAKGPASFAGYE